MEFGVYSGNREGVEIVKEGLRYSWDSYVLRPYAGVGYTDFAGSCVVHVTGGTGALVGAVLLG